jgi:hypothetical protein
MKRVLALSVLLAACHPLQDASQVDAAVEQFHTRLASGDDDAIYREAGPEYQRSLDAQTNRNFLARVRRKMGTPGRATRTGYNVMYNPGGATVNTQYQVSYSNGAAAETFVWRVKDGKATLLGFTINSPLMLTD